MNRDEPVRSNRLLADGVNAERTCSSITRYVCSTVMDYYGHNRAAEGELQRQIYSVVKAVLDGKVRIQINNANVSIKR